ncbi:hypothetical protein MASR1M90_10570 [Desulfovibrionales bacterium]
MLGIYLKSIFGMILAIVMTTYTYGGGFYKWRDANGKLHITNRPPDDVSTVEEETDARINKIQIGNLNFGFIEAEQGGKRDTDTTLNDIIHKLESEIRYLESRKRMDPSMEPAGLRRDIRRKEEQLHELRLLQSGASKEDIALSRMQNEIESDQNSKFISKSQTMINLPLHGMTDQYGVFYAPAGNNNYLNTKTGSLIIHQGGNTYLDSQTGRIMHGF